MNDDVQFENHLRRRPLKSIPATWRDDILQPAVREIGDRQPGPARELTWMEAFRSWATGFFAAAPKAWAGLATVWVVILVLNVSGGDESTTAVMLRPVSPAQTRMALQQKQLLLIELAGRPETRPAAQPRSTAPGPRTQRKETVWAV
jgi:hypothetical protein